MRACSGASARRLTVASSSSLLYSATLRLNSFSTDDSLSWSNSEFVDSFLALASSAGAGAGGEGDDFST